VSLEVRKARPLSTTESADGRRGVRHLALIIDGNRRWARSHRLPAWAGHEAGAATLGARVRDALELGVGELTVYALSTENWTRSARELSELLDILTQRIAAEMPRLDRKGVRVRFFGSLTWLPGALREQILSAQELTDANRVMTLFVAVNYGARAEILDAARRFRGGGEGEFRRLLRASEMHDPELIVRTGGEQRLSNFLLWQSAYSELVFREELWPDFTREALEECLAEFDSPRRRFGRR
jgi:undecaprenyl diphosphate synthase